MILEFESEARPCPRQRADDNEPEYPAAGPAARGEGDYVPLGELGPDLERLRFELDALASFGFAIEQHPYRGAAYRRPGRAALSRPDRVWSGDGRDRTADRGLEPRHEHQRPGCCGRERRRPTMAW